MPELPEVETISRALREGGRGGPSLVGNRINDVKVYWDRSIQHPDAAVFCQRVRGQVVTDVGRRGKFIIIHLSQDDLVVHLRMSGDLRVETGCMEHHPDQPKDKHDRVIFFFEDQTQLIFEDTRKFGRVWLVPNAAELLHGLGPEPFDPELTVEVFHQRLTSRKRLLKPLLLDQYFLAGMGNIYTDEALYRAGIHPLTISSHLSKDQAAGLLHAIRKVLKKGIEQNGASIDWVYRGGSFQNFFHVYQRAGEECHKCGHKIERIVVGQRGTHYCPVCQPYQ